MHRPRTSSWVNAVALLVACSDREAPTVERSTTAPVAEALPDCPAPSVDLPPWFGAPAAPPRRIAGMLLDGDAPLAGDVHLRIEAPDATVWVGLDRTTGPDGRFDFGELRAGRYTILATATGRISRQVAVDTRGQDAGDLRVYAYPCRAAQRRVHSEGKPVAGARVDIGGVEVATSDAAGWYSLCLNLEETPVTIRAPGYAPRIVPWPEYPGGGDALSATSALRGRMVGVDGAPLVGWAVQPVNIELVEVDHGSAYLPVPVQATTDAQGRFVLLGAPTWDLAKLDREAPEHEPAQYTLRVWGPAGTWHAESVVASSAAWAKDPVVHLATATPEAVARPAPDAAMIRGRVTVAGRPLPDARVGIPYEDAPEPYVRTDRDGVFTMGLSPRHGLETTEEVHIIHATGFVTRRWIDVIANRRAQPVAIAIAGTGSISGRVVTAWGAPEPIAEVALRGREWPMRDRARVDAAGRFSFTGLEIGQTYDLVAFPYNPVEIAVRLDRATPDVRDVRITAPAPRTLAGIAVDAAGTPIAGAAIGSTHLPGRDASRWPAWEPTGIHGFPFDARPRLRIGDVRTGADGRFAWTSRSDVDDDVAVLVQAPDGRVGLAASVAPWSGPPRITVARPGAIRVVCQRFTPREPIALTRGEIAFEVTCGSTVRGLPPGRYRLGQYQSNGEFAATEVDVASDATVDAVLAVAPPGSLHVTVVDRHRRRWPGVECDVRWIGDGRANGDVEATSDARGQLTLAMSQGRVKVTCWHRHATAVVTLGARADVEVMIVPHRSRHVDTGATIRAEERGARVVRATRAAASAGLTPGDLVLAVDGRSLAGLSKDTMRELAFCVPPRTRVAWTVERDGVRRRIVMPAAER